MSHKTVVFYHADCIDGFGAAYAAWKKLADTAEYIPVKYGHEIPADEFKHKTVFFLDFCYPQEIMDDIVRNAESVVVIDHHEGIRNVVEHMPKYVFDSTHSGATIAWKYFHPDAPTPELLIHVEDEDLYTFRLADTRPIGVYLSAHEFAFSVWDDIARQLADAELRKEFLKSANLYLDYFNFLVELSVKNAHPVHFEGYTILMATASPMRTLKSAVANVLSKKMPPFAMVTSVHPNGIGVSIRGDGSVDVAAIARKYGGNGHPSSAGFRIPWQTPMPFTSAEEHMHEDSSN
ncbi:hypothetical protein A3A36_00045 [Candidatus Kaiserbacteria bacterium RIFCSPLOWO2_01_FULL_52_12b]|uniref:DHHA1 domain-containing protein n=1 Tax=Candidatus Kaiserbacteria bacterium RIFCSPLOWO2_01_FULL_52_12b TaxID=1798509 RepID=A0A1F6EXN6_9BACT|nr:MAG: hypothetical protein A3A36_00045 [Candidatus Kaiserbacteria bacterium RIFCSPLOWO2_01_FULL_52_12b]